MRWVKILDSNGSAVTFPISDTVLACVTSHEHNTGVVGGVRGAELPFLDEDPVIQEVLYTMGDIPYTF